MADTILKTAKIIKKLTAPAVYGSQIVTSGTTIHNDLTGRDAADGHPISAITGLSDAIDDAGTTIHNDLTGRDAADAHPISAITGLSDAIDDAGTTVHNELTGRDAADAHDIGAITDLDTSLAAKANSADLGAVATSNDYDDLDDKPTIPEDVSDLTDDDDLTIPAGGTSEQVLAKASNDDNDVEWVDQSGGGGGDNDYYDYISSKFTFINYGINL